MTCMVSRWGQVQMNFKLYHANLLILLPCYQSQGFFCSCQNGVGVQLFMCLQQAYLSRLQNWVSIFFSKTQIHFHQILSVFTPFKVRLCILLLLKKTKQTVIDLKICLGDPLKPAFDSMQRIMSFLKFWPLHNCHTLLHHYFNGQLLNFEVHHELVLNCFTRNLNNSTSSLTSTIISYLSSHDSKLKVSSQICCPSQPYPPHPPTLPLLKSSLYVTRVWGRHGVNTMYNVFNKLLHATGKNLSEDKDHYVVPRYI